MTADAAIRVVIADDHPAFRAGIRSLLEHADGIEVVGEAADGRAAVAVVGDVRPDVILLDIAMPELNGIEATREIKASWPEVAVLILTVYDDEQYISALIGAGAAGYLLKTADADELVGALNRVRKGESVLSASALEKVLARLTHPSEPQPSPLTARELQVLQRAALGEGNKVIARDLELSVRTVDAHFRSIFGKLGVASRTEAVMQGVRQGWLTQSPSERV